MSDFEKELEEFVDEQAGKEEEKLPTLEEQRLIVAQLKQLEEEGKLTPEVLEEHFAKFFDEKATPIH